MRYNILIHPAVEEDLNECQRWYEGKNLGLGEDFLQRFYTSILVLESNPLIYPKIYSQIHR